MIEKPNNTLPDLGIKPKSSCSAVTTPTSQTIKIIYYYFNFSAGEHVAKYISWLNAASGARLDNYHIIGHSLGGHQVGVIGRQLRGQVPYITSK